MLNFDYLYNPGVAKEFNKNYFVDKELGFGVIEKGMIVPHNPMNVEGREIDGGIVDSDGAFVKSSSRRYGEGGVYIPPPQSIQHRSDTVIYLGLFSPTWGHIITDNIRRLWFLKSTAFKSQFKKCPLVYVTSAKFNDHDNKNFFRLLEILGLDVNAIKSITQPTQFERIILPDESYRYALHKSGAQSFFTNDYVETIDRVRNFALKNRTPTSSKKIYYLHGLRQIGEERLAEYFRSKGYDIVRPETLTLDEQLNLLINCESFASTLGSISHNSLFLRDGTETIFISRRANAFTGCQRILDQVHDLRINYLDSTLSVFAKGVPRANCFIISKQLKQFFGDKFDGYAEDDFKIFLQYVKTCMSKGLYVNPIIKKLYGNVLEDFVTQLKQHEDLIAAYNMPRGWNKFLPLFRYWTHVGTKGWRDGWKGENQISNSLNKQFDLQAVRIHCPDYKLYYAVYYNETEGWSEEVAAPKTAGKTGIAKSIFGVKIRFDEAGSKEFDILYRLHKFDGDWTPWAKNGETLYSYGVKLNAIQIKLKPKT